jgi:hypothetical protein
MVFGMALGDEQAALMENQASGDFHHGSLAGLASLGYSRLNVQCSCR